MTAALLLLLLQTSPEQAFGHRVGADGRLQKWAPVADYLKKLDAESDRVLVEERGASTEGRPYLLVTISSAENLKRLEAIKSAQRKLADPRLLDPKDDAATAEAQPCVVLFLATQHSTEVAATQTLTEMAWSLAAAQDEETLSILDHCVILLVPSANPDGVDKVIDWYERTKDSPHEGSSMPWLYQKYVGHDNNRDWYMLTQVEQRNLARIMWEEWFPVITVDLHQMGSAGARFFVSPFADPINPNIPPIVNQQQLLIAGHVATDMTMAGQAGVVHTAIFDNWWHGDHSAAGHRHNTTGILTETASCRIASPIFLRKDELDKDAREPLAKFAKPWPGGWWRLRDIVDYQLESNRSILRLASRYRDRFNRNFVRLGRDAIEAGKSGPVAYVVPATNAGTRLVQVLRRGGVEIHRAAKAFRAAGASFPAGTWVVLLAQPYRSHVKDLMERQKYPDRFEYPGGPVETPYDVTGWTLPLQMGVDAVEATSPFEAKLEKVDAPALAAGSVAGDGTYAWKFAHRENEAFVAARRLLAAGHRVFRAGADAWTIAPKEAVEPLARELGLDITGIAAKPEGVEAVELGPSRVALYQPWTASMDEGWTRFVLEGHAVAYETLRNAGLRAGNLRARFDVILIPSIGRRTILEGRPADSVPPEYVGGIGEEGVIELQKFVESGGHLVLMGDSSELALRDFGIGVRNARGDEGAKDFSCPGSLLRARLDVKSPLAWGAPSEIAVFVDQPALFRIGPSKAPEKDTDELKAERERLKRAAERFPAELTGRYSESLLLLSGWALKPELAAGAGALVDVAYGGGRIVLFGFRPQHRAQTEGTFRLLFNALERPGHTKAD